MKAIPELWRQRPKEPNQDEGSGGNTGGNFLTVVVGGGGQAMEHAVMSTRPRIQYRVGMDAKYGLVWTQLFPLRIGEMIIYGLTTNPAMRAVKGLSPPSPRLQA
jgi:hypothetical protein